MVTETGAQIADSVRYILREIETINEIAVRSQDPLAGKLRLGAIPSLAAYIFPQVVEGIKASLPNIKLILIEEKTATLIERLKHGEIDLALLALPVQDDFFVSEKLFDDKFYLAVPGDHELAKYKTVDQKILSKYQFLLLEEGHCLRDQALEVCKLNNIAEDHDVRATGIETLRSMVKAGTGITFMPEIAINELDQGICYIPFTHPALSREIGLVWRKTTARIEVIDKLVQLLKKI
jgi:LysR family hydrogen peroxide-inducible transcriptional activator